jgi:DNA-binding MarR family transcriptional regulator
MRVQKPEELLELGKWMGRKQAFASLAGGCSAADAECLRQMRSEKRYRALGVSWAEFCKQRLGLTQPTADKIIKRLEEFGPQYFRLAQATGIAPEEYRRIAGSVSEQGLAHAGELIPISAEEAPRLMSAVAELRQQAEPETDKSEVEDADRVIEKAERLLRTAVDEVGRVEHLPLSAAQRAKLLSGVSAQTGRLSVVQTISLSLKR